MTKFISIQNTYQTLELGLFGDAALIDIRSTGNQQASKEFIPLLQDLLGHNNQSLRELSCMVVNQGPGPFATLRVVIASVNGISFATNIPLVGIDGLDSFIMQYSDFSYPYTVVLLNAFNYDVYFALQQPGQPTIKGCKKIDQLLRELVKTIPCQTIRFLGNATKLYQDRIREQFNNRVHIPSPLPSSCSIEQIARMGLQKWKKQKGITSQLLPLYLKQYTL